MEYSYLSDIINNDVANWLVRVRVCRLWEAVNTKDDTLISMNMILVDEKGNLMHAVVRKHLVSRFKRRVSEDLVYSFRNFRPLASVQKLLFLATTEVVELGEDAVHIPKYGFQFVDLSVLRSRADDVTTLSDIVGYFCGFGEVEVVGDGFKKRDIKIFTDYCSKRLEREMADIRLVPAPVIVGRLDVRVDFFADVDLAKGLRGDATRTSISHPFINY